MRRLAWPVLLALAACASVPPAGVPVTGQWGGRHVGLVLSVMGGTLEYDCAAGGIAPVVPAADGSFEAHGTHTPGSGGPEVVGEVRPTFKARYSGSIRGEQMALTVAIENGVTIGPLSLRRGAEPIIFRCL